MESGIADLPAQDAASSGRRRFSLRELAQLAHTSPRKISSWVNAGLLNPAESGRDGECFTFQQVRTAALLARLSRNGVGTAQLKRILCHLRRRFPDAQQAVSQLGLFAGLLIIRDDESRLTAPNGQLLLDILADGESSGTVALKLQAGDGPDADEFFQRAVALEQSGDLTGAAEAYRDCLLETGPEPAACFNLANVLDELGETAAAAERYRQVVELDPHYAAAWNNLGRTLSELRKTDEAIAAWQRAVEIDPGSADALFNLADALHEQGRLDEACPYWQAYVCLDGESDWSAYASFCLDRARN
jgi:tetratricopeptide (TPR) repeat protein